MSETSLLNNIIKESNISATIEDISWERIWLRMKIRMEGFNPEGVLPDFYLTRVHRADAKFEITEVCGNLFSVRVNITNQGEKRCVAAGNYALHVVIGNDIVARGEISPELAARLPDCSRSFLYRVQKGMYSVAFYVAETDNGLPLQVHIVDDAVTVKGRSVNKRLLRIKKLMIFAYRVWSALYRIIYRKKNTILFFTEKSNYIGSNQAPLMKRMIERGLDKKYRIREFYSSASSERVGVWTRVREVNALAKANIIIVEDHTPMFDWLKLRDDVKLLILWHAGAGYKSVGYSRWGHLGCPAPWCCHRQYAYGIAASKNIANFFSEAWGINESHVLPTGMPRFDIYLDVERREKVSEEILLRYPMIQGKKVILFAPTYRGSDKKQAHYPYELIDFDGLAGVCGDEYVVFFRMHPWVKSVPIPEEYKNIMIDVGDYPSINDLFYVTDLYIGDYSSGIFEYSLMRRPALFFAYDEVQYSLSRGFHRDYRASTPGKVCATFDELLKAIKNKDYEFEKIEPYINHHFDYTDTGSCDRVIDWLILDQMPEELKKRIEDERAEIAAWRALEFPSPPL